MNPGNVDGTVDGEEDKERPRKVDVSLPSDGPPRLTLFAAGGRVTGRDDGRGFDCDHSRDFWRRPLLILGVEVADPRRRGEELFQGDGVVSRVLKNKRLTYMYFSTKCK